MLIMLKLYFLFLPAVHGFLLDTSQGNGGVSTTNQYLTLSKFYEEMKFQQEEVHRDTTKLRHDTDNSLALLTTQLQQKFDLLDKKLAEIEGQNKTFPEILNFEQKYLNLEQNFNTLQLENNLLQSKKDQMENELFLLRNETIHQGQELAMLKNKSSFLEQNIEELKTLRSIKPLQDFKTLQQEVKSISVQTSSLNMKEQARSQDVLALYNQVQELKANSTRSTTNLTTQMKTLQMNSNTSIMDLGTQIMLLQTNHNTSITDLDTQLKFVQSNQTTMTTALANIESKVHEATLTGNRTFTHLQRQTVAMTAQPASSSNKIGIIKFDNVKLSIGINNLSGFRSNGKFTCEKDGLYLISASITSNTNGAYYRIYLNGNIISYTRIRYNNQGTSMEHTGTVVVGLQLHANDSMWVYNAGNNNIYAGVWSTLTIVKIK